MIENEIIEKIKVVYPEFIFDEDELILNMNNLVMTIFEKGKVVNVEEINKFFDLVNSFNTGDEQLYDVIEVGFLEVLTDTSELQRISIENLKFDLLQRFNKLFDNRFWRLSE